MKSAVLAWALTVIFPVVDAIGLPRNGPKTHKPKFKAKSPITEAHFEQLIDHSNPSLGTFSQRYWYDLEYWAGSGSPVVISTPGEVAAASFIGYCTNATLNGAIAYEIGAATIVIEHRYWGKSSPYQQLTTANLQHLTLQNNIADLTYFARNVQLPFATTKHPSNAQNVPWILMGGSYSGALTAWTAKIAPGTFWAYLATSAVVESISNFWQYYVPVQQGMPRNCSIDMTRVIDHLDKVMEHGTTKQISAIKAKFGLAGVEHNDDFMNALTNGPYLWQEEQFYTESGFHQFCDYIENAENVKDPSQLPGPDGVGLQKALDGYAKWQKDIQVPGYCEEFGFSGIMNTECYNTHNASSPLYADVSVNNNYNRQWNWMLCNQPFGWWADGAPIYHPTIASRLLNVEYWTRQCAMWFPTGPQGQSYGIAKGQTQTDTNAYTGGWENTNTTRLIYVNGQFDPWRYSTVSSVTRPGGPLQSTAQVPVHLIPGGFHGTDQIWENGDVNAPLRAIQNAEISQVAKWVKEYPEDGLPPQGYQSGGYQL